MNKNSIYEVAARAKVSTATVSRVLNGKYSVSDKTKEKVQEAIRELNYYPNTLARSLKNYKTNTIGFVVSSISNSFFQTMVKSIEDECSKDGYNVIVCSTEHEKDRELSYLKMLVSKKVDGIVLNTTGMNNEYITEISKSIPIVLIERKIGEKEFVGDYVTNDNVIALYSLTSHLLSLGHRKIGIVNGNMILNNARERFEGFKRAMKEHDIEVGDGYPYRFDTNFTIESGFQAAKYFMSMDEKPTAIITSNNMTGVGTLKYLHTYGIQVPRQISVAVYGEIENSDIFFVQPTVVALNPQTIGTRVFELLLERIKGHNRIGNREILYMPQLIIGGSTAQLRQT